MNICGHMCKYVYLYTLFYTFPFITYVAIHVYFVCSQKFTNILFQDIWFFCFSSSTQLLIVPRRLYIIELWRHSMWLWLCYLTNPWWHTVLPLFFFLLNFAKIKHLSPTYTFNSYLPHNRGVNVYQWSFFLFHNWIVRI